MTTRATVKPELLVWARKRAGIKQDILTKKFPKLLEWERGETRSTYPQLDAFARTGTSKNPQIAKTSVSNSLVPLRIPFRGKSKIGVNRGSRTVYVPSGYLFLKKPLAEKLPIADFRTFSGEGIGRPSPNLLDMIHVCQERQEWYRDFGQAEGEKELPFVGSATIETPPKSAASRIREALGFDVAARKQCRTWTEALRLLISKTDEAGILTMVSGVVLSKNKRRLDPGGFRGFALTDPFAPLVFINGADTQAAQMFTLAHELGHIWLGNSALSNMDIPPGSGFRREEVWCNTVAAEMLAPLAEIRDDIGAHEMLHELKNRLARKFKVSSLVILRRLLDAGRIGQAESEIAWKREKAYLRSQEQRKRPGGDFRLATLARVGRRFAWAIATSTLEGHTLFRDAFRFLGISSAGTFDRIEHELQASKNVSGAGVY